MTSPDPYRSLDSLEGIPAEYTRDRRSIWTYTKLVWPGLLIAVVMGMAAGFLSQNYGGPVMLFALLIGIAFNFLSTHSRTAPGIEFASRTVLRLGVALLGVRITVDHIIALGWSPVLMVVAAVILTTLSGLVFAKILKLTREEGLLSGGAVAICGASAALALSSVMPRSSTLERNTILTVVGVTTLSTIAMIIYPLGAVTLGMDDSEAGIFLGGTIHDVAQVVGAGYTISTEAGDTSTIVKLLRVAMLLPVVLSIGLLLPRPKKGTGKDERKPPVLPWFLVVFVALVAINSAGFLPGSVVDYTGDLSRWCLIGAIAGLGMKTSFEKLILVGWRPVLLMVAETAFMAALFLLFLQFPIFSL